MSSSPAWMSACACVGVTDRTIAPSIPDPLSVAYLQPFERRDQGVDILVSVVRCQRRAHGRLEAETAQDRLGTVVTRADGDAFLVEQPPDFFCLLPGQHERDHASLFGCRSNDGEPGHAEQALGRVDQEL